MGRDEQIADLARSIREAMTRRLSRIRTTLTGEIGGMGSDLLRSLRGQQTIRRSYESASNGRRLSGLRRPGTDGDAEIQTSGAAVRKAAREIERNSPYGRKIIADFAADLIGTGIVPQFQTGSDKQDRALRQLWDDWSWQCDPVSCGTIYGYQYQQAAAMGRDGGSLTRRRMRYPQDVDSMGRALAVPMQLQQMEIDYLDTTLDGSHPYGPDSAVVGGIAYSAIDQRIAYRLFRQHPGSRGLMGSALYGESNWIPAAEIAHLYPYVSGRPGQALGVSLLHAVIARLWDWDSWQDATLLARRMTASTAVFIEDMDGSGFDARSGVSPIDPQYEGRVLDSRGYSIEEYEPGGVGFVPAGKRVVIPTQTQSPQHEEASRVSLREVAAGVGMTYEGLSNDLSGVSYISGRMGMLSRWRMIDAMREHCVIPLLVRPVVMWWLDAVALAGTRLPRRVEVRYVAPPRSDSDEERRVKAVVAKIRAGLMSPQDAIVAEGADPETLLEQLASWNSALDRDSIVLDSDPRRVGKAGAGSAAVASDATTGDAGTGGSAGGSSDTLDQ